MERLYKNRPKPLMGLNIVYHLSDVELLESYSGDMSKVDDEIRKKHPELKEIKTVRYACWIYKGVTVINN